MALEKRKKTRSRFWEKNRERFDETDRMLRERIEYHRRRAVDEAASREQQKAQ